MPGDASFQDLLARLRARDNAAAARVVAHFGSRLIAVARRRLPAHLRPKVDPEDVLQSAFRTFFRRTADGQLDPQGWGQLWSLLVVLTLRKCHAQVDHYQAGLRDARRERDPGPAGEGSAAGWEALDREPTPDEAAALAELVEGLLTPADERDRRVVELARHGQSPAQVATAVGCGEEAVRQVLRDRQVAELTLQGYTPAEVRERVGCSERTVFRVLARVRKRLEAAGPAAHGPC